MRCKQAEAGARVERTDLKGSLRAESVAIVARTCTRFQIGRGPQADGSGDPSSASHTPSLARPNLDVGRSAASTWMRHAGTGHLSRTVGPRKTPISFWQTSGDGESLFKPSGAAWQRFMRQSTHILFESHLCD